jgi:hypothetical protein
VKREIFRRGVRMTHQFGTLEGRDDPFFGTPTFDPRFPERVDDLGKSGASPPLEIGTYGEHRAYPARSAVVKPNGEAASLSGPAADRPEFFGAPIPVGTKRRLGPLKTDK